MNHKFIKTSITKIKCTHKKGSEQVGGCAMPCTCYVKPHELLRCLWSHRYLVATSLNDVYETSMFLGHKNNDDACSD